jgi:hypothetical protein
MSFNASRSGWLGATLLWALAGLAPAQAQDAASLKARYATLREALGSNQFQRPLYLESREDSGELQGDVYARVAQPFGLVGPALQGMEPWCDILILHLNVKRCRAGTATNGDTLRLNIGRKYDQPLADAYLFEFRHQLALSQPDYLCVVLSAAAGPLGTSRYRIVLELVALDPGSSFVHLSYAYAQGTAARWATRVYLTTVGRAKVGFSIVGRRANGQPIYIGSTRGVIERNAMRFYLAIEAYLGALSAPAAEQGEQRLNDWFAAVERYPVQLHELGREEYLQMKRLEIRRQQTLASAAGGR